MNGFEEFVCWVDKDGLVLAVNPGCVESRGPYVACYVFILPKDQALIGKTVQSLQEDESCLYGNPDWVAAWEYFNTEEAVEQLREGRVNT